MANSVDSDQMSQSVVSDLGLYIMHLSLLTMTNSNQKMHEVLLFVYTVLYWPICSNI